MPNALVGPANPTPQAAPAQPNALAGAGAQAAPKMPAPTHAQTITALRHFAAISKQLDLLIKNPDLGKADIRKAVIDSVTKLVGDRIIPPTQAVQQMASFPDKPFDQKQWLINMGAQNAAAKMLVVMHHAAAHGDQPPYNGPPPNADNHIDDMAGMMADHFPGKP